MNLISLTKMELKLFFRESTAAFWTFIFPPIMLWIFGSIFGSADVEGYSYVQAYVPSWMATTLMSISLFTIGATLTTYREQGVLLRYQATPVSAGTILLSHFFTGAVLFTICFFILMSEGMLVYNLHLPKYPLSTLLAAILSMMAMFSLGLFVNSLAKNPRQSAAISSAVLNLMMFLSGATIPLSVMPSWLQTFAKTIPLYYVVDILRATWSRVPITELKTDVIVLIIIFILFSTFAIRTFRWSAHSS